MSNKHLHIGPGGRHCTCCFPPPGSKDRRAHFRSAKRKADRAAKREMLSDLAEPEDYPYWAIEDWYDFDSQWLE